MKFNSKQQSLVHNKRFKSEIQTEPKNHGLEECFIVVWFKPFDCMRPSQVFTEFPSFFGSFRNFSEDFHRKIQKTISQNSRKFSKYLRNKNRQKSEMNQIAMETESCFFVQKAEKFMVKTLYGVWQGGKRVKNAKNYDVIKNSS